MPWCVLFIAKVTIIGGWCNAFFTAPAYEYQYDLNGNRTSDANKKISNVTYNKLNLPSKVTVDGKGYIEYLYYAAGVKLQKRVFKNGVENKNASQTYIGSYIYDGNGQLLKTLHEEGYITADGVWHYFLRDHLGNTRVDFAVNNAGVVADVQDYHYYPFGMDFKGLKTENSENKYRYNGKELQEDFGLDWYDYGARFYDAQIGRWHTSDELADDIMQVDKSPYQYAWNTPVNIIDPDGNCPWCLGAVVGGLVEYGTQVAGNILNDGEISMSAFTNVNCSDIVVEALSGGLSGGLSQVKNAGKLVQLTLNAAKSDLVKSAVKQGVNYFDGDTETIGEAVVNVLADGAIEYGGGKLKGFVSEKAVQEAGAKAKQANSQVKAATTKYNNSNPNKSSETARNKSKLNSAQKSLTKQSKEAGKLAGRNVEQKGTEYKGTVYGVNRQNSSKNTAASVKNAISNRIKEED